MTQPSAPPPTPPPAAPPAPTGTPPVDPGQTGTPPGWPSQAPPGYPAPQAPPVQYVPVMPIPQTLTPPAAAENGQSGDTDLTKLPQWAQKQITDLRDEAAKRRISERTAVVNQHAWAAAQQLGTNAQALLGSLAWQQATKDLDPSSADFGRHMAETIWKTVQANPWMAAAAPAVQPHVPGQPVPPGQSQPGAPSTPLAPGHPPTPPIPGYPPYPGLPAGYPPQGYPQPGWPGYPPQPPVTPPTSGAEFTGGNNAGAPISEAQLAQMSPEQIVEALNAGKLSHLM